jgi:hypothetical protein
MALSANSAVLGANKSRLLNRLSYDFANKATDITTAATGDIIPMIDISADYELKYADAANVMELLGLTVSAAELNTLDLDLATNVLTRGAGVDTAESYASSISKSGSIITTRILMDISTLIQAATDLDIIGESGAASCHWGQITVAKSGTLIGGSMQCLEVPAGGSADIDLYSATVSTGTQDVDVTTLTETALVTSGGSWTSGTAKGMTLLPAANDYLYLVSGAASGGTLTAGKFLITLYGV